MNQGQNDDQSGSNAKRMKPNDADEIDEEQLELPCEDEEIDEIEDHEIAEQPFGGEKTPENQEIVEVDKENDGNKEKTDCSESDHSEKSLSSRSRSIFRSRPHIHARSDSERRRSGSLSSSRSGSASSYSGSARSRSGSRSRSRSKTPVSSRSESVKSGSRSRCESPASNRSGSVRSRSPSSSYSSRSRSRTHSGSSHHLSPLTISHHSDDTDEDESDDTDKDGYDDNTKNQEQIAESGPENNPAKRDIVAVNEEQQLADIFKLNIDCFELVFDYLSLKSLTAVSQTCKRMQTIAGYCFQLNYRSANVEFYDDGFYHDGKRIDCFKIFFQNVQLSYMCSQIDEYAAFFVENGRIKTFSHNMMMNFVTLMKDSTSIKRIEIGCCHGCVRLRKARIKEMLGILSRAERVTINTYENENVLDRMFGACSNAKFILVKIIKNESQWMHRIYPTLEHFAVTGSDWHWVEESPGLKTFLELNTNIKQFSVNAYFFWLNGELFKSSNIKLDTLAIEYDKRGAQIDSFCRLLNELHESGFYKKLHVHTDCFGQEVIDQLASVKGLVSFCDVSNTNFTIKIGALRNLEELYMFNSYCITDLKILPHILLKLKCIHILWANSDDILPFICHSKNLNKIRVYNLSSGSHCNAYKILDLFALNKEREKLVGAHKITIYIREDMYLSTKWAMKQTDFSLIEIKRISSYDWSYEFSWNFD
ncbi:uncharacterized protein LOC116339185 [Contarinia nasturtii]|uniref:uncharacterized protein LOC116339185 n=1 Tax=Contarinia nasturtii TaxID=265458 RepID=UPI0012D43649|nr:uncharacterized protein LOC116339185 [Contarinia nasturtii]